MVDSTLRGSDDVESRLNQGDSPPGSITDPVETLKEGRSIDTRNQGSTASLPDVNIVDGQGHKAEAKGDKTKTAETHELHQFKSTSAEHRHLEDLADSKLKEPARSNFKHDMEVFEKRAEANHLSPREVDDTYKQIERLLEAKGDTPVPEKLRRELAVQVLQHAAYPKDIDQGAYNTCNMTTVEKRTYALHPSSAARVVADVTLNSEYKASDGTTVQLDAYPPHGQSKNQRDDGQRDYASEVFQVTAANLAISKDNDRKDPPGKIRYEQVDPDDTKHDNGERLMDYSKSPPEEVKDKDGKPIRMPGAAASFQGMIDASDAITGKQERDILLSTDTQKIDGLTNIRSEGELDKKLQELKAQHRLPAIIGVDCANSEIAGFGDGKGINHVVTVADYQPGPPPTVQVDNQWGRDSHRGLTVHDLFQSSQPGHDSWKTLQDDVMYNRAHDQVDYNKEFELLNLQRRVGVINDEELGFGVQEQIKGIKKDFDNRHFHDKHPGKLVIAAIDEADELPPDERIKAYKTLRDTDFADKDMYDEAVARAAYESGRQYRESGSAKDGQAFQRSQTAFMQALSQLPYDEQLAITKRLSDMQREQG